MRYFIYLIIFLPFGLLAQMGIGTSEPTALLEIKTQPTGRPALGLVPQSNPIGSSTGQMAVVDNKLYLFDEARDTWLSVEQTTLEYGRLGAGSTPSEIEFSGDLQNGPRMPFDGTIVSISISATEDDNGREIGLFLNGVGVPDNNSLVNQDGVFVLNPTTLRFKNTNYNFDFNEGDMLSLALLDASVNDIDDLIVTLIVKWRKDN